MKEQRMKELEDLVQLTVQRKTDKATKEGDLKLIGDQTAKQHEEEHQERKAALMKEIEKLTKALDQKSEQNRTEEAKLTSLFESADKMYVEALDSYDTEMQNHQTELAECNKEYEERAHELNQLQDEWHHRQEERRKTEAIQEMMEKKEEDQRKKMALLSNGAEWI